MGDQYRKDGPDKHPPQERDQHHDRQNPDPHQEPERPAGPGEQDRPDFDQDDKQND